MTISFPLSAPASPAPRSARFHTRSIVGQTVSPFTGETQSFAHQGQWWELDVTLPPMTRADAEAWIAFFVSLNGREGTFLYGPPGAASPRGTATSATASGSAGATAVALTGSGTLKAGDWIQIGTGASAHLHKVLADATLTATVDIWPRLRAAASGSAVLSSPKGVWRLGSNEFAWDVDVAQFYGISFSCIEAL